MRTFLAAVSMLSALPLGRFCPTETELRRSLNLFPAAGLLFGAFFYGIGWCLAGYCAPLPAAMLLALLPEALTKGLHLDGLADTADGFLSGRSRERKLEIMRDSRTGSMGVAAIFALLGMKFAFFASLPPELLPAAAGLMMLGGRSGIVLYIGMSRYARPDGMGAIWYREKPFAGILLALLLPSAAGWFFFGVPGCFAGLALAVFAFVWSRITKRVIGGATGDTIGCCEELSELLILAGALAVC